MRQLNTTFFLIYDIKAVLYLELPQDDPQYMMKLRFLGQPENVRCLFRMFRAITIYLNDGLERFVS